MSGTGETRSTNVQPYTPPSLPHLQVELGGQDVEGDGREGSDGAEPDEEHLDIRDVPAVRVLVDGRDQQRQGRETGVLRSKRGWWW